VILIKLRPLFFKKQSTRYRRISALEDEWDSNLDRWGRECKEIYQHGKEKLVVVEEKLRALEHEFDQKVDEVKDSIKRNEDFQLLMRKKDLLEQRLHEITLKPSSKIIETISTSGVSGGSASTNQESNQQASTSNECQTLEKFKIKSNFELYFYFSHIIF